MSHRKRAKRATNLQTEQLKLVKIQTEVESILGQVNESINALKVEELQLKSSAVAVIQRKKKPIFNSTTPDDIPTTSLNSFKIEQNNSLSKKFEIQEIDSEVNKQEIDLDMFVRSIKPSWEEEEESD